jgi:hypothetical protein
VVDELDFVLILAYLVDYLTGVPLRYTTGGIPPPRTPPAAALLLIRFDLIALL